MVRYGAAHDGIYPRLPQSQICNPRQLIVTQQQTDSLPKDTKHIILILQIKRKVNILPLVLFNKLPQIQQAHCAFAS